MDMRQRMPEIHAAATEPGGPAGAGGPSLGELHAAGQNFLKAGRDAVSRALSKGKSEEFLANNRQQGGQ
jgi:hypothetical protein